MGTKRGEKMNRTVLRNSLTKGKTRKSITSQVHRTSPRALRTSVIILKFLSCFHFRIHRRFFFLRFLKLKQSPEFKEPHILLRGGSRLAARLILHGEATNTDNDNDDDEFIELI